MKRWSILVPALMLLLTVLLCPAGRAEAAEILYSGNCGTEVVWTLNDEGVLTVSGSGDMVFANYGEAPWRSYANQIQKVVVTEGVTSVAPCAFQNAPRLKEAEIAGSVSVLGSDAFWSCVSLSSVTLGEGIQELGTYAFTSCESLRSLTLPASVTLLGDSAFFNCEALEEVIFLGNAPAFGSDVFRWDVLTAYYPVGNDTWTAEVRLDYGGDVTWVSTCVGEHTWSGWGVSSAPTCTMEGRETRFCMTCFRHEERVVPSQDHIWSDWEPVTEGRFRVCEACAAEEYSFDTPRISHNIGDIAYPYMGEIDGTYYLFYRRWATTVKSTLVPENGGYTRVEYVDGLLIIETYDADLNFVSCRGITTELPIYGGVYLGEDYNFVASGQENMEEDNQKEVIRITRYTKDWVRIDDANLYGGFTTVPFDAGTLRFARCGDMLYVRTCHEMYTSSDGLNHQANINLSIHIPTMEITDGNYTVSNHSAGYVSHSFNQFVLVDGEDYIAVDHGDAYPRAVVMFRVRGGAGIPVFPYSREEINVLPIAETTGHYNDTGVGVGGVVASSTHYIAVGNSVDQSGPSDQRSEPRNIFVTVTPKDAFTEAATQVIWLTDYDAQDGVALTPPHIVQVDTDRFLVIWMENISLHHCYLNGKGEVEGPIYENPGALSDCVPVLDGDGVLWYVTGEIWGDYWEDEGTLPVFYRIDLSAPGVVRRANCYHEYKSAVTEPTCTEPGCTTHTCILCGHSYTDTPTEPLGHRWGDWKIVTAPTLEAPGEKCRECTACGLEERETMPVLEFIYGDTNGDGSVNGKDLILLRQSLAGWDVTLDEAAADCNGDAAINGKDLILLRQYLAGWDVTLGPTE